MSKIIFDSNIMKFMSLFSNLTHADVKDCIVEEDRITFIVLEGEIGKAVGKHGVNVKRLQDSLKRKIKIVEFNSDTLIFIKNLVYPLKIKDIKQEEGIVTITGPDVKTKGLLIGKNAANLRQYEAIVKRYFDIEEIKVI